MIKRSPMGGGGGTFTVDGYTHCNPSKDLIKLEHSTVDEINPVLSEENFLKGRVHGYSEPKG